MRGSAPGFLFRVFRYLHGSANGMETSHESRQARAPEFPAIQISRRFRSRHASHPFSAGDWGTFHERRITQHVARGTCFDVGLVVLWHHA